MSLVLLYNLTGKKAIDIKMICHKLNLTNKTVGKDEFGYKLGYLCNVDKDDTIYPYDDFDNEMILFANLPDVTFDKFLKMLRQKKATVDLKAVLTQTNKEFTSSQLFEEISKEHLAMQNGNLAHNQE
ncbi:MAG: DUF3783 domain-containing protein [Ruminococcus sp.]